MSAGSKSSPPSAATAMSKISSSVAAARAWSERPSDSRETLSRRVVTPLRAKIDSANSSPARPRSSSSSAWL